MRFTFLLPSDNFTGGARVIAVYASELQKLGHQVLVVTCAPDPLPWRQRLRACFAPAQPAGPQGHIALSGVPHQVMERLGPITEADVPDADVDRVGRQLAAEPGVTLCYRRTRSLPHWSYNLFCMVHGRSREEVQPVIERLSRLAGLPAQALFSTRRFKQCGARYFAETPEAEAAGLIDE